MERVCRYRTEDGKEFEDVEKTKEHEIFLETQHDLEQELLSAIKTSRPEAVISLMIYHAPAVRDILNKHLRRQPKKEKVEV